MIGAEYSGLECVKIDAKKISILRSENVVLSLYDFLINVDALSQEIDGIVFCCVQSLHDIKETNIEFLMHAFN